jgi:hypothetical protein
MRVGILIPVCSRAHSWTQFEECFLVTHFLPSFRATKSAFDYQIYIGVDDNDAFFLEHLSKLETIGTVVILNGCNHAPAWAWNQLAQASYDAGDDYMFQIGDDVILETPGWTEVFIRKLESHRNRGVVGPINPVNAALRGGKNLIIENAFVHRSHLDVFPSFFHSTIRNWHCDEWLTRVYDGVCSHTFSDIRVRNGCVDKRYAIESVDVRDRVREGKTILRREMKGCFSFCLYGEYTDKYYLGLIENVALIRTHYPGSDIRVYASPTAAPFVEQNCKDVILFTTPEYGSRNMAFRFIPAFVSDYDFVCVRDTDSRIHARDRWCIDAFLDSPYTAYATRDHMWHAYRMMGGLWGCKRSIPLSVDILMHHISTSKDGYTMDTTILEHFIYPLVRDNLVVFSHVPSGVLNDPTEKVWVIEHPVVNDEFCGNVVLYKDGKPYHEFTQV